MYCPYCGTKLEDNQLFCHKCGESQIFEEDEDIVVPVPVPVADVQPDKPEGAEAAEAAADEVALPTRAEADADASPAPTEVAVPADDADNVQLAEPAAHAVPAANAPAVRQVSAASAQPPVKKKPATGEKRPATKGKSPAKGKAASKGKSSPAKGRAASVSAARQKDKGRDQVKVQLKKSVDYIKHIGIRQLIFFCVAVIVVILVSVVVAGAIVKANQRHILAVVSDDLNYYVDDESTMLELNFVEDDIADMHGGAPAGALAQMGNAVLSQKNVLGYLDDYIKADNSWTLKINDLSDPEMEIRVDSGVYSELLPASCGQADSFSCEWKMSLDGSVVFYIKDMTERGGSLYRYSGGETELVGSNCLSFNISDDGQRVCWVSCDLDGAATVLTAESFGKKGTVELLDTQLYDVIGCDEGLGAVYYTRTNGAEVNPYSVYVAGLVADKERLVSGVSYVSDVGTDGGFFYTVRESSTDVSLYWRSKSGEENLVTRTCSGIVYTQTDHGIVVYYSETLTDRTYYLYCDGMSMDCGDMWAVEAVADSDGRNVYLMLFAEGEGRSLYYCEISAAGISKPQCIAQRCSELLMDEDSDTLFYAVYSADNAEKTSLYIWSEGESHLLSDDAYPMVVYSGDNSWAFFTGVSSAKYTEESPHLASGTLNIYCDGNVTEIDDDVAMLYWYFGEKGTIIYIKDYLDAFGGTLYVYTPEEGSEKLAIDVQALLPERKCLDTFGR